MRSRQHSLRGRAGRWGPISIGHAFYGEHDVFLLSVGSTERQRIACSLSVRATIGITRHG